MPRPQRAESQEWWSICCSPAVCREHQEFKACATSSPCYLPPYGWIVSLSAHIPVIFTRRATDRSLWRLEKRWVNGTWRVLCPWRSKSRRSHPLFPLKNDSSLNTLSKWDCWSWPETLEMVFEWCLVFDAPWSQVLANVIRQLMYLLRKKTVSRICLTNKFFISSLGWNSRPSDSGRKQSGFSAEAAGETIWLIWLSGLFYMVWECSAL